MSATLDVVLGSLTARYLWGVKYQRHSPAANAKLGKNLARLRNARGLNQNEMAERLGISTRHLQRVEAGKSAPSLPLLLDLYKTLKTSWNDIFSGMA